MTEVWPTLVWPSLPLIWCKFGAEDSGALADLHLNSTDHFYPALNWLLQKDKAWMQYYTKNFYVGELDWTYAVRLAPSFPRVGVTDLLVTLYRRAATLPRASTVFLRTWTTRAR